MGDPSGKAVECHFKTRIRSRVEIARYLKLQPLRVGARRYAYDR